MRRILVVLGLLVALAGAVWTLQGIGVIAGSFMSNNSTWVGIGAVTVVIGVAVMVLGFQPRSAAKKM